MKHNFTGRIGTGWTNLDKPSRQALLAEMDKIAGAVNVSESDDPAKADGLLEFNLMLMGYEIVSAGSGFQPPLGTIRAPPPLDPNSWDMPAYIVPMNL